MEHRDDGEGGGLLGLRRGLEGVPGAARVPVVGEGDGAGEVVVTQHHSLGQSCTQLGHHITVDMAGL